MESSNTEEFLLNFIKVGVILVFFTPLIVAPIGLSFSEYPKALFFRVVVEILLIFYLLLVFKEPDYLPKSTILLWSAVAFVLSLSLSSIFGFNFKRSFLGDFSRSEGLILYLHLLAFFVIAAGIFKAKQGWVFLFRWIAGVSFAASIAAFLQKLGATKLYMMDNILAILNNSSFFGSYLLFPIFLCLALFFLEQKLQWKILWIFVFIFDIFSLFLSASRGAWLGFLAGILFLLFAFVFYFKKQISFKKKLFFICISLFVIAGILLVFFTFYATFFKDVSLLGRISFSAIRGGLEPRFELWRISLLAISERPLFGWGLESFSWLVDTRQKSSAFQPEIFFDRPHNKLLEIMVSAGFIGFAFYILLFGSALYNLVKSRSNFLAPPVNFIFFALLTAYFAQNFFVFDNISTFILFFTLMAFLNNTAQRMPLFTLTFPISKTALAALFLLLISPALWSLYFLNLQPLRANLLIVKGFIFTPETATQAFFFLQKAIEQKNLYQDDFKFAVAENLLSSYNQSWAENNRTQILGILSEIEPMLEKNLSVPDKLNRNYYLLLSGIKEKKYFLAKDRRYLNEIEKTLERAIAVFPSKPQFYRLLGQTYIMNNKFNEGEFYYEQWYNMTTHKFTEYKQANFYKSLGGVYFKIGERKKAAEDFKKGLDVEYAWARKGGDPAGDYLSSMMFADEVARFYFVELKDFAAAKKIYEDKIEILSLKTEQQNWLYDRYNELFRIQKK